MKKFAFIIFIIVLILGCSNFNINSVLNEEKEIVDDINKFAYVTSFTVYGRFLNIEGYLLDDVDNLSLVFKSSEYESEFSLITNKKDNKLYFKTSELINQGINLENILVDEYVILLKTNDSNTNYYTLKNIEEYDDITYYTITKNNQNKKIDLKFINNDNEEYLFANVINQKLPSDIYDIVIDPGHGGYDVGAAKNGYFESHINLDYAKKLKIALEELGLKVKLTRETDVFLDNYGDDGRVSIPYDVKAKLLLSIHQNSSNSNVGKGGVEIYVPNHSDITFASNIAKNIVDNTSSIYSSNVSNKVAPGTYLRTFSKSDLADIEKDAIENNYKNYEKATLDSTYYYIIRETGGLITNAYVDGRDKSRSANKYYDSNHGIEAYLLELGYMNSKSNLDILLKEKDDFVDAIKNAVKDYFDL